MARDGDDGAGDGADAAAPGTWFEGRWERHLAAGGAGEPPDVRTIAPSDPAGHPRFAPDVDRTWPPGAVYLEAPVGPETVDEGSVPVRLIVDRRGLPAGADAGAADRLAERLAAYVTGKPIQYLDINANPVRGPFGLGGDRVTIAEATYRFEPGDEERLFRALARAVEEYRELFEIAADEASRG